MPFARWETFDACVIEQKDAGHDEESAKKICGAIQERAEKGELYKSADQQNYDVICKSDSELIIGGFASWELVDPENDLITAEAQAKYLQKLFKLPPEYRNIMVGHSNYKIGEPLLKYEKDGQEYFSHVNEKGLYLLAKIRNDNFKTTQKWREKILKGEMSMYSIAGLPLESEYIAGEVDHVDKDGTESGPVVRKVTDIEPWEITVCEKGVNPKAKFKVLAKEIRVRCDIAKCNSECCRHIALKLANSGPDFEKYARNHGIKVMPAENGASWVRLPVVCGELDQKTGLCKSYENRPELCKNYPFMESSPFIEKSVCPISAVLANVLAKSEPEKPKKDLSAEEILHKYGFSKAKTCRQPE